jgi:Chaperone of endosialidase
MNKKSILLHLFIGLMFVCLTTGSVFAQTTAFTYQGKLTDSGTPQGAYQMRFELYDAVTGGNQIGATVTNPTVVVTQGVFTVSLDFGAAFDGTDRFLEIAVKRLPADPFTVLTPRQKVTSAPYSLQSSNSVLFDSLSSNRFVQFDTVGNVGLGIVPRAAYKLDVVGNVLIDPGNGNSMVFGSPNGETGMSTIVGSGRADIRFDGSSLKLVTSVVGGPPSETNGIRIDSLGRVGIGTTDNFLKKFHVVSTDNNQVGMVLENNSAFKHTLIVQNISPGGRAALFEGTVTFGGVVSLPLADGGFTPLCRNINNEISNCSSSLRYKKDFQPFGEGLNFINQLNPIAFKWKAGNMPDIGFGAEDIAKINPLFVTYNAKREVEGVKYDRLSVVFVNAFKEQQTQIEAQQSQIKNLKELICLDHPNADVCQEK